MARYTIDAGERFDRTLTELSSLQEVTKAEVIKRAVAFYSYLVNETQTGNRISITDNNGKVLKDVVLPS